MTALNNTTAGRLFALAVLLISSAARAQPTIPQADEALMLAEKAADNQMYDLAISALARTLQYGPPAGGVDGETFDLPIFGARANLDAPLPKTAEQRLQRRIPLTTSTLISRLSGKVPPQRIYELLRDIVCPPQRNGECFFYASPTSDNLPANLSQVPAPDSVAVLLLKWADRTNNRGNLLKHLQQNNSSGNIIRRLLMALVDNKSAAEFTESVNQAALPAKDVRPFLSHAFLLKGTHPGAFAACLEKVAETFSSTDESKTADAQLALRGILLREAAACWFEANKAERALTNLRTLAESPQQTAHHTAAARMLIARDLNDEALDLFGSIATDIKRSLASADMQEIFGIQPGPIEDAATAKTAPRIVSIQSERPSDDIKDQVLICELNVETKASRVLFALPDLVHANRMAVAANGKELLLSGTRPGRSITSDSEIFAATLDGKNLKAICPGTLPSLSPDGHRFAYCGFGNSAGLWIRYRESGQRKLVDKSGWGGVWSPDGRTLVYRKSLPNKATRLEVFDFAEDRSRPLAEIDLKRNLFQAEFAFNAAGDQLLLPVYNGSTASPRVLRYVIESGNQQLLNVNGPSFLRDNLSWGTGPFPVCCGRLRGSGPEQLLKLSLQAEGVPERLEGQYPDRRNLSHAWLPNGRLVYVSKPR